MGNGGINLTILRIRVGEAKAMNDNRGHSPVLLPFDDTCSYSYKDVGHSCEGH